MPLRPSAWWPTPKERLRDTDRQTFQAMEALVHNLNTMHSRAGAQTPFSSVNYGMDTSPEGRMVIKNMLLATEGPGLRRDAHLPRADLPREGRRELQSGGSELRSVQAGHALLGQAPVPELLLPGCPVQPQYYKGHAGNRDRLHGLPHPRHGQRVRPRSRGDARPRQPVVHVHQPAPSGHPRQGRHRPVLRPARLQAAARDRSAGRALRDSGRKNVYNAPFLMGQGVWIDSESSRPPTSSARCSSTAR